MVSRSKQACCARKTAEGLGTQEQEATEGRAGDKAVAQVTKSRLLCWVCWKPLGSLAWAAMILEDSTGMRQGWELGVNNPSGREDRLDEGNIDGRAEVGLAPVFILKVGAARIAEGLGVGCRRTGEDMFMFQVFGICGSTKQMAFMGIGMTCGSSSWGEGAGWKIIF